MSVLPPYLYFIAISFLVSCSVYRYSNTSPFYLKIFPPFLLATLVVEAIGAYFSSIGRNNVALYNLFTVVEFCFYLWVISAVITKLAMKYVLRATSILYALASVVNIFFIQKMQTFHSFTYAIGCLLIVIACIYYFFELFRVPKAVSLVRTPAFWICSGLLFFYCCGFPLFGLSNFISGISPMIIRNFTAIITIMNIFLYSLFTIAFLCRLKTRKYFLSQS